MSSNGLLLEVEGLRYAYPGRLAVQGVSFGIHRGEIFGLLGPNGAGKTTTISCISGLLARWQGAIRFDGQPFVPSARTADRRRLGVVPQELALYDGLSGRENLRFFGRLNGLSKSALDGAVSEALAWAGLSDRADDRVGVYSGGMKRRLNLAAGMLHRPDLVLLDEPTVGVDPQSRNHIFEALGALRKNGHTLLYTTHYMEEAQRLCDRVAVMHEGLIAGVGTADELATQAGVPGANLEDAFLKLTGRSLRDE
jgi:ABC-2 type transport system ATP-binding protein